MEKKMMTKNCSDPKLSTVLFLIISPWIINLSESSRCRFDSIISFGDSLSDTGNRIRLNQTVEPRAARWPYGRTFFHRPTGRFSDGRLIIDFIAESLQLPYVEPFLGEAKVDRFVKGVNFAVAGATALDRSFFEEKGMYNPFTNVSLGNQIDWLKQLLATNPGKASLEKSLILFGEIGGNDYNDPIMEGVDPRVILPFAPEVIKYIGSRIQELIKLGAKTLLVPGIYPIGCFPIYLTMFETPNKDDYDPKTGCIKWLNEFAEYHNELLKNELRRLRRLHPRANIIYADYYNVAMRFYRFPERFGFTRDNILVACCGAGGTYNYKGSAMCAISPAVSCDDPSKFANWDGMHFSDTANEMIAKGLLEGPYTIPRFETVCSPPSTISAAQQIADQ